MMNNVRGFRSKETMINRIISEENPVIIALAETNIEESEHIDIPGYEIIRADRKSGGGGVLIAHRRCLKNLVVCTSEYKRHNCEMLWEKIDNGKFRMKIGAIYMPQESRTKLVVLQEIYKEIEKEVVDAKEKGDSIIITGDLNCKIGNVIKGNREEISKGGRLLMKMVKKHNLRIVNAEECCNGVWTRVQGEQKSVIDYMIVFEDDMNLVKSMEVDEAKDI